MSKITIVNDGSQKEFDNYAEANAYLSEFKDNEDSGKIFILGTSSGVPFKQEVDTVKEGQDYIIEFCKTANEEGITIIRVEPSFLSVETADTVLYVHKMP